MFSLLQRFAQHGGPSLSRWPRALHGVFAGGRSHAGPPVTPTRAAAVIPVYSAVARIAGTVATLPLIVNRDDGRGGVVRDPGAWQQYLLGRRPHKDLDSSAWRRTVMCHLLLWGNCWLHIGRDSRDGLESLWPIEPSRVTVELENDMKRYRGGRVVVWLMGRCACDAGRHRSCRRCVGSDRVPAVSGCR